MMEQNVLLLITLFSFTAWVGKEIWWMYNHNKQTKELYSHIKPGTLLNQKDDLSEHEVIQKDSNSIIVKRSTDGHLSKINWFGLSEFVVKNNSSI